MKKLITLALLLVLATSLLCSCTDNAPIATENNTEVGGGTAITETNADKTDNTENKEIDLSIFPEVKASSENINVYREEVSKKITSVRENKNFITAEEWEAISNSERFAESKYRNNVYFTMFSETSGEISEFYYPVVFRDGDMLVLWYTTQSGKLKFAKLHGNGSIESNNGIELHIDISNEEIISSKFGYATTYIQETGEFKVWQFGEVFVSYSVPKNSIYCGFSFFEGYIFRNGTDIYALNALDTYTTDGTVECIAHNVKYVIDADYYYGSGPWCQPLFIMKDGSVKCYIGWKGDKNAAPDDTSHLFDPQFEGSWDK